LGNLHPNPFQFLLHCFADKAGTISKASGSEAGINQLQELRVDWHGDQSLAWAAVAGHRRILSGGIENAKILLDLGIYRVLTIAQMARLRKKIIRPIMTKFPEWMVSQMDAASKLADLDRSKFIRHAIREKMERMGIKLQEEP
jgi:hypothetical protein